MKLTKTKKTKKYIDKYIFEWDPINMVPLSFQMLIITLYIKLWFF